jgi:hypothetical protein
MGWSGSQYEVMKSMDIYELKRGDRVRTPDWAVAEILNETQDGQWILVRYLESNEDPSIVGTEDLAIPACFPPLPVGNPAGSTRGASMMSTVILYEEHCYLSVPSPVIHLEAPRRSPGAMRVEGQKLLPRAVHR